MTINPLSSPPTPPNGDLDRAMFAWLNGTAGNANDPIKSDTAITSLLTFCGNKGVNKVFLDCYNYIGGSNWNPAQLARAVHYLKASGIKVYALAGNTDWGHNQQWVSQNWLKKLEAYQSLAASIGVTGGNPGGACFDGIIFDVEYWTAGVGNYGSTEPIGLCDLMNATRRLLGIPVGCFAAQWLADSTSGALSFAYNGLTQLEGLHLLDQSDFVAVAAYSSTQATQQSMFQNWFARASLTGSLQNKGIFLGTETASGLGAQSYWTGSSGALATMESSLTTSSSAFKATPNTNMAYLGAAIDPYNTGASGWAQMT